MYIFYESRRDIWLQQTASRYRLSYAFIISYRMLRIRPWSPWRTFRDFALRVQSCSLQPGPLPSLPLVLSYFAIPSWQCHLWGGEATCKEYSIEQKAVLGTRYSCYCYLCCKSLPVVALGDISFSLLRCSPSALEALPGHLHVLPYHAIM